MNLIGEKTGSRSRVTAETCTGEKHWSEGKGQTSRWLNTGVSWCSLMTTRAAPGRKVAVNTVSTGSHRNSHFPFFFRFFFWQSKQVADRRCAAILEDSFNVESATWRFVETLFVVKSQRFWFYWSFNLLRFILLQNKCGFKWLNRFFFYYRSAESSNDS